MRYGNSDGGRFGRRGLTRRGLTCRRRLRTLVDLKSGGDIEGGSIRHGHPKGEIGSREPSV